VTDRRAAQREEEYDDDQGPENMNGFLHGVSFNGEMFDAVEQDFFVCPFVVRQEMSDPPR